MQLFTGTIKVVTNAQMQSSLTLQSFYFS